MNDIPDPDEDAPPPPPRKTSQLAWAIVWVIFLVVLIDILSIQYLGNRNSGETFKRVGSVTIP